MTFSDWLNIAFLAALCVSSFASSKREKRYAERLRELEESILGRARMENSLDNLMGQLVNALEQMKEYQECQLNDVER